MGDVLLPVIVFLFAGVFLGRSVWSDLLVVASTKPREAYLHGLREKLQLRQSEGGGGLTLQKKHTSNERRICFDGEDAQECRTGSSLFQVSICPWDALGERKVVPKAA